MPGLFRHPPTPAGTSAFRIQLTYLWRHRRFARLAEPRSLTEWVQHRKLHDRDPRLPLLADKVRVKPWVERALGPAWVTPTLWQGTSLPAVPCWPFPYIVKARHGCQQSLVVADEADHARAVAESRRWMRSSYGGWLDEWLYGEIERGLLVEPFLGTDGRLPIDYKIFVFGGVARFVQIHVGRGIDHRWIVLDRAWRRVSLPSDEPDPHRPATLAAMLLAAERLGAGFSFVRVDLYEIDGMPRFGELTFYPGSGLEPVEPRSLDEAMGAMWTSAVEIPATVGRLRTA